MRIYPYEFHQSERLMPSVYKNSSSLSDLSPPGVTSSSTSADTDGEGTWNSGCDGDMPVASPVPFQAAMAPEEGKAWWTMRYDPAYQSETEEQGCSNDEMTKESTSEEMEPHFMKSSLGGSATKLCPRGHWRPAEDEKLRELVSHYGPQNWNLIAEKLHGRSGS